ncbi:MAG: type II toxin-antitoxin system prevent-host-death family antitoxin [Pontimonas sp.]|jgi:antitoxin YefM
MSPNKLVPFLVRNKEAVMAISASEARARLFPLIEEVNEDNHVVEITSKRGSAVLMSKDEYDAIEETAHLLRSPANMRRLIQSIDDADTGTLIPFDASL